MHCGISAVCALANHINKNLATSIHHISKLSPIVEEGFMVLDSFTIKNLNYFILYRPKELMVHLLIVLT